MLLIDAKTISRDSMEIWWRSLGAKASATRLPHFGFVYSGLQPFRSFTVKSLRLSRLHCVPLVTLFLGNTTLMLWIFVSY